MTGQNISHYRILEKLGEGGMGIVYKAEDTKLRRTVALKFLPPHATENRERFLREAQAAASLNHPNICTIFEVDEEHSLIAMELVEGNSVKDKIAERPLKLDEALDIAIQTCQGLQAAHEKGVVHRDIKPANLMLTKQGQVKIMDFGLAQISDRTRLTRTGSSLGTPAYMSPEQSVGEATDRRTDIWSLGVVLYEMVTGRLPFPGGKDAAVAHSILHLHPEPPTSLRSGLPVALDRVAGKALSKNSADRYQHIDDFLVDLRTLGNATPRLQQGNRSGRLWLLPLGAAALFGLMVASRLAPGNSATGNYRYTPFAMEAAEENHPSWAPDGKTIAYFAEAGAVRQIFTRSLNSPAPAQITKSATACSNPFWSPDGTRIYYLSGGSLWSVGAAGGGTATGHQRGSGRGDLS